MPLSVLANHTSKCELWVCCFCEWQAPQQRVQTGTDSTRHSSSTIPGNKSSWLCLTGERNRVWEHLSGRVWVKLKSLIVPSWCLALRQWCCLPHLPRYLNSSTMVWSQELSTSSCLGKSLHTSNLLPQTLFSYESKYGTTYMCIHWHWMGTWVA